jgi:flagellar protein FlgJ
MTPDLAAAEVYTDIAGLARLKAAAGKNTPEALRAVARQFESLFVQMVLKSMREASFGDPIFDSQQSRFYQGMFDQQLATTLASRGPGIGLADMLVRQLSQYGGSDAPAPTKSELTPPPPRRNFAPRVLPAITEPQPAAPQAAAASPGAAARLASASTDPGPRTPNPAPTATDPGPRPPDTGSLDGTPENFVRVLWPHARRAARALGVAPEALMAQAALETGWGRSVIHHEDGRSSHNLFGIKADARWSGEQVGVSSLEYIDGAMVRQRSAFRAYDSYAASFNDYVDFLKSNPRYGEALKRAHDPVAFSGALQRAGYATDPAYASKIQGILGNPVLADATAGVKIPEQGSLT